MSSEFIKPNQQIKKRREGRKDNWSDTNYLVYRAYFLFRKETGIRNITFKQFCQIPRRIHNKLLDRCLQGRYSARVPNLGVTRVVRFKAKEGQHVIPDWVAFRETGVFTTKRLRSTSEGRHSFVTSMYSERNPEFRLYSFHISDTYRIKLSKQGKTTKVNYKLVED